jgi:hypothetical protein
MKLWLFDIHVCTLWQYVQNKASPIIELGRDYQVVIYAYVYIQEYVYEVLVIWYTCVYSLTICIKQGFSDNRAWKGLPGSNILYAYVYTGICVWSSGYLIYMYVLFDNTY